MKDRSFFPSGRASALFISSISITFVFLFAYTENLFENSFTPISNNPRNKLHQRDDRNQNEFLPNVMKDGVARCVDVEQNKKEESYEPRNNNGDSIVVVNIATGSITNKVQRNASMHLPGNFLNIVQNNGMRNLRGSGTEHDIFINSVPETMFNTLQRNVINNIPNTEQGRFKDVKGRIPNTAKPDPLILVPGRVTNSEQGIFNSNLPDRVTNSEQGIFNSNVLGRVTNSKQGIFNNNVPGRVTNSKQGIFNNNVPGRVTKSKQGIFNDNVPGRVTNSKQGIFNNNVPGRVTNSKQGIFNNNVPGRVTNSKQGIFNSKVPGRVTNSKQGIFNSKVPGRVTNSKQGIFNSKVPGRVTNSKQGIFNSNVPGRVTNSIQGIFNSNVPGRVTNSIQGIFNSKVPGSIVNTLQSNVINNIPYSIPAIRQPNVMNVEVPYPDVHTASSGHRFDAGLPQYAVHSKRKSYVPDDNISIDSVQEINRTVESLKVTNGNAIHRVGMRDAGDVMQTSPSGTNSPPANTNNVVLLLTYLRSGSTLTADIIQQVPGVFYAYEPLRRYLSKDDGFISMNGICSMNNLTCRQPTLMSELPQFYIEDIVRYYGCDLERVVGPFLWSGASVSVRRYKKCKHISTDIQSCLHQCFDSTRYLKTIRLSMDIVEILMKIIPRLKVVHLLRDPRGMIHSRKRGGFLGPRMHVNVTTVARSVCQRFDRDIQIAMKLKQKYPGRLKTYLYEQIAEHPKVASTSLFDFLGLTAPDNFDTWLHNHTAAGTNGKYYGTTRANSSLTASLWRLHMSYNDVLKIDNECHTFYNYTGFLKATSQKSLRDLNFHLRLPSPEFGFFNNV